MDDVPLYWKPAYWLYGYTLGFLLYFVVWLQHTTCKVTVHGKENLIPEQNYIFCFWHQDLPGFFAAMFDYSNYRILNHPVWYMKPVHVCLHFMGMKKIYYGSSGHAGKAAAIQLTDALKNGSNTFITPDGPSGPLHEFKKGALHLSINSGIPILPVRFEYANARSLSAWDKKRMPRLFSRFDVYFDKPITVDQSNFDTVTADITQAMSE
ncbi:MAG: lysophospholipid acyltransferase (LPLAT)-like uncharacterized protein [Kangiellaceae bacterium]